MEDDEDVTMDDVEAGHEPSRYIDDNGDYPNRPHNHSSTFPFHDLFLTLFNPLQENRKKTGPQVARKKQGPHGPKTLSPTERRNQIVERFIGRWRKEVGDDIYPAFRLIIPDKDRDRAMYGLKEKTIAKLLVRVMKIDKNAEDAQNLLNWKLPGYTATTVMAGDFAGRCYEVIKKRPMRTSVGNLTIAEVNEMLDRLSAAQKEDNQMPILEEFYNQMNADEMMWLIRMILRQMKVGATEKTFFDIWHPDAENLFNVSSSLKRVCWELHDQSVRLDQDDRGINLMSCFQPQLAAFQMRSMESMVARMNLTEDDPIFWIEEKLDGERMQLHMREKDDGSGVMEFKFWSRKAKDYTYLYGESFEDDKSALTRHIKEAFNENVRNIILDGEMITWDPKEDAQVPFGTLKTAALSEQRNPFAGGWRPFFKAFDCLYLNDKVLTNYTMRDRRKALESSISDVHRRLEIHPHVEGRSAADIEPMLRNVIAESSEGLVIKNPRSMYRLNSRNDDWIKVKPEYMTEFGEALDCIVIGGYYGSGNRGGRLSSFMCGLRVDQNQISQGASPQKCYSFFKVGGGFSAADYAEVRHRTEGKWHDWDSKKPPTEYIELGGGDRQYEKPDVWIMPEDSLVFEVKAAQVTGTDQFRLSYTLRFPRFKRIRADKDWKSALSIEEFVALKETAEASKAEKQFKVDDERRSRRQRKTQKKKVKLAGQDDNIPVFTGPKTKLFEGLTFYVLTEQVKPKKPKEELERLVKINGGNLVQTGKDSDTICVADRNTVKVASTKKTNEHNIVRPIWILDCIRQAEIDVDSPTYRLPLEPRHIFHYRDSEVSFQENVDEHGDSYARDVTKEELRDILERMASPNDISDTEDIISQFLEGDDDLRSAPGFLFRGLRFCIVAKGQEDGDMDVDGEDETTEDPELEAIRRVLAFGDAALVRSAEHEPTHLVVETGANLKLIQQRVSRAPKLPRLVTPKWVQDCWKERTLLDEERYTPR